MGAFSPQTCQIYFRGSSPPQNNHALGGWALAHLSVFILFAYLHINLTEFFEGKDHGSFISIFWPPGAQGKKKKKNSVK